MCDKCVIMGGQRRIKKAREQRTGEIEQRKEERVKRTEERGKKKEERGKRKDVHSGTPALTVLDLSDPNQERLNGLPSTPPRTRPKQALRIWVYRCV